MQKSKITYFIGIQFTVLLSFYILRIVEFFYFKSNLIVPENLVLYELLGILFDTMFWATYMLILGAILLPLFSKKSINTISVVLGLFLVLINILLQMFFVERGAPLDKELVINSLSNSITTVKSSNLLNIKTVMAFTFVISVFLILKKLLKRITMKPWVAGRLLFLALLVAVVNIVVHPDFFGYKYSANKTNYLVQSIFHHLTTKSEHNYAKDADFVVTDKIKNDIVRYQKNTNGIFVSTDYPLLQERDTTNTLGEYFNLTNEKPNIVFLAVESLSRDISGPDAELGNFVTPFLDSLANKSLYWDNCLSTSAISYEMLPSSIGSLPYGRFGFNMLPRYPNHLSIIKVLRNNGYHSSFITGAPMHFDNQGAFMRNQGTDFMSYNFPDKYNKMNQDKGWNWGYPDDVIFKFGIENLDNRPQKPFFDVYVTIVTHPPYNFDEKDAFGEIFDQRLKKLNKSKDDKKNLNKIRDLLSAFIYTDQSIEDFFNSFKKRDEFKNTIFIITGDHHGYFEPKNELGKFHVPLIIYSPLLKSSKRFKSLVSHLDIVPSIINLLDSKYNIDVPAYEHWMGNPLNTNEKFVLHRSLPLIDWNKSLHYYVDGKYFLNKTKAYEIIDDKLNIKVVKDTAITGQLINKLDVFNSVNDVCCYNNAIMPDSLMYQINTYSNVIAEEYIKDEISSNKRYPSTFKAQLSGEQTEIKVEIEFEIILPKVHIDSLPKYTITVASNNNKSKKFKDTKDLTFLNNGPIRTGDWVKMTIEEYLKLDDLSAGRNMEMKAYFFNSKEIDLRIRNYSFRILNHEADDL